MRYLCRSFLLAAVAVLFSVPAARSFAQASLVHRYSFNEGAGTTVTDSIGGAAWNGSLPNGGTWFSGEVSLASAGQQYVQLPGGILSNYTAVTVEAWVTFGQLPSACFLFGFGNMTGGSGEDYIFCQPRAGRIAITDANWTGEQNASGAGNLSLRTNLHVTAVFNPPAGQLALYTNGVLAAVNNSITVPFSSVNNVFSFIGRSLYSGDSYFNFRLSEFRLYRGALTPAEIQANFVAGPENPTAGGPVELTSQPQSQSVVELTPVTFAVTYRGVEPVGIQWQRNGLNLLHQTNLTYSLAAAAPTNHGDVYRVVLTNRYQNTNYTVTSSNATLTVAADVTVPVLVRASSLFPNEVAVQFSEPVSAATGTNTANYSIAHAGGALAITAARFGATASEVILTTAPQIMGTDYTLTINGIRDRAAAANLIAANSQVHFVPIPWITSDVGLNVNHSWAGIGGVTNALDFTASGAGVAGTSDQFAFGYQNYTGDFDVQVRVSALSFASAWTRAGLMARSGLASNAIFAASFATPGPAGCHFESRTATGAGTTLAGSFPVNFPDTWLRLRRVGNVFEGFASLEGQRWEPLGSAIIGMADTVQVGLAVTAGNSATSTTAKFRDFAPASGLIVTNAPLPFEPPGPSSRATSLVITEIMYNPPDAWGGTNNLEFVELWNSGLVTEDLTGFRLTGEIEFAFPTNTTIAPGQFLVIAKDPSAAQNFYGVTCLGPYKDKLANGGGTLRLVNELGGRMLEIEYDNKAPWPVAPDGTGHSLVLTRPSYGENNARAWSASERMGGSPGGFEHYTSEPARGVVINEFLAHTDLPQVDFIELFNTRTQPVDLSGAWLSDKAGTNLFRIPDGTLIPARGFLAFTEPQLGFALAADGESIFLVNSNQTRVLDAVRFDGQENGVSSGRLPDGAPEFHRLTTPTLGTANGSRRLPPVVINEIMYHPISERNEDEYVELYNRSGAPVNLAGWKLQGGISFTFPQNASIPAGGYVVVAANRTNLLAKYAALNAANTFGDFSGALANSGERIALAMTDDLVSTNAAGATTNWFSIVMDEVTYADGGRWGQWSDGGGSSLERVDPNADGRLAANWADSDESAKAAWTQINVTNVMENGQPGNVNEGGSHGTADRFEVSLQGPGEALLDNVEFLSNGGANLITNGTFTLGTSGWTLGGVLRQSFAEAGVGMSGSQALHMVSTDRGDTGPNKLRFAFSPVAATGAPNTGTFRAAVRWLKGSPYILLRIRGNWAEVSQRLNVPANCGTPGQANSRAANPGPAIYDVTHTPILPAANQPVVVTARATDPNGVASLTLRYRIDPATSVTSLAMLDNGTGGDAIAGDGVYSATLPGNAGGVLVAFTLAATDGTARTSQFPAEAGRECLVRWGDPVIGGSIASYRLWVTSSNINFWAAREKNANDPIDATFVYGNSRVCYNVNTLYSGSPFHAPTYNGPTGSTPCDYEVNFPPDDRFLGSEPFVLTAFEVNSGNFFMNDSSAQVDLTAGWIGRKLGQQYTHRRHVHVVVNGLRRGTIYDDAQQPNREMLDQYFPKDERGQLRKIESWFEFQDDNITQGSTYTTLTRVNKSTGEIDAKRYRWNWRPRATDNPDDWADFLSLITAVNNTNEPNHETQVRTWMDVPNFLRPVVTHHICGGWDSYGYDRGKNMFAYKPDHHGWRLMLWDLEISLGAGGRPATDSIYNIFDKTLFHLITNRPAIHREYLRGFQEALDTALQPGATHPVLDERYAAFQQNNVPMASPTFIKTYLLDRRTYLLSVIPNAPFAIATTNQTISSSNVVTLTGTGPLSVETILVNSNAYPVRWTSISNWTVTVPLVGGSNLLNIVATDRNGNAISNATGSVGINYTGSTVAPDGLLVFNEIHHAPAVAGGGFVELYNSHPSYTRDLSGWSINGLGYTFPAGSVLAPQSFLVLAENPFVFNQIHGASNVAFGTYDGTLDRDGETLTLLRPSGATNAVVDRVRYEATAPWPMITNGASLQLLDAAQDNSRVANWAASLAGILATPGASNSMATNLPVFPPLWLNEAQPVNLTGPLDNYNQRDPWAEIYNAATTNFTLSNFYLSDSYTNLTRWAFPAGTVVSNSNFRLVWCDNQTNQTTNLALHAPFTLGLPNGTLVLSRVINGLTQVVDYLNYTNLPANWSFGSVPDAQPFYRRAMFFATPGATNNGASQPITIFINEWLADNTTVLSDPADGQFEDWFELYNPGTNAVNLGGYYLTDNLTNKFQFQIPNSGRYVVPAGGYLLVWADGETGQNSTNRADLHVNFALSKSGEALGLFAADGTTIDAVTFGAQTENVSEGRFPDGGLAIWSMPTPTPRAANVLSNTAPLLAPIADRILTLGQTLTVAVNGADDDLPPQALTYSLSNAPSGASIDPDTGLLTWTPTSAPATNSFHVTLTDNGTPPQSTTQAFAVVVMPRPALNVVSASGGVLSLHWISVPGHEYQVEFSDSLTNPNWLPASEIMAGTGHGMSVTNAVEAAGQRFFRLRVEP